MSTIILSCSMKVNVLNVGAKLLFFNLIIFKMGSSLKILKSAT